MTVSFTDGFLQGVGLVVGGVIVGVVGLFLVIAWAFRDWSPLGR